MVLEVYLSPRTQSGGFAFGSCFGLRFCFRSVNGHALVKQVLANIDAHAQALGRGQALQLGLIGFGEPELYLCVPGGVRVSWHAGSIARVMT